MRGIPGLLFSVCTSLIEHGFSRYYSSSHAKQTQTILLGIPKWVIKLENTSVDVLDSYQTYIKRACNDRLLKNNQWLRHLCKHEWGGTCCIACLFRLAFRSSNAYSFILFPYQKPNIFLTHDFAVRLLQIQPQKLNLEFFQICIV